MKKKADYKLNDGTYKRINIWDILNDYNNYVKHNSRIDFKTFYNKFYKGRLLSTHDYNKLDMSLVVRKPYGESYFRFIGDRNPVGSTESLNHKEYKEIVKDLNILNLSYGQDKIKIFDITYSEVEYPFVANENNYVADVYFEFQKSEPIDYFYRWNGKLVFEIKYTHPVDDKKRWDCYNEGIAIFEHSISDKLKINESGNIQCNRDFISSRLSDKIYGELISNPKSEEFKMIENLKDEILQLQDQKSKLEKNVNDKQSQIEYLEKVCDNLKRDKENLSNFKSNVMSNKILKFLIKLFKIT